MKKSTLFPAISPLLAYGLSLFLISVCTLPIKAQTWGHPVIAETPIGTGGDVGEHTSLKVVNGNPAMAYYDDTHGNLMYMRATDASGTAWGTPIIVDAAEDVGKYTSLAIVNGNPAISYYDATNANLKYVRAIDASGTAWGTPIVVVAAGSIGIYTSLSIVNGRPAISYYDLTNSDLKYVRATNASGTAWMSSPVTLDATGDVGKFASLAIVNGHPAISYYDATNTDLKYVRATDVNGGGWGTPITISATGDVGLYTSLAIVNGNPAISYYDYTNGNLKYVRATNASGTAWGTPITINATGDVGSFTSLVIVNGNPAISYRDVTNKDLKYVGATNASGTAWGMPIAISGAGDVGQFTSLAIVNGNPAISYYDWTNGDLKYVRATDASGTAWGTPITIDATGFVGQYTLLTVVNGNPAISYYDDTNDDLKYVRATDADGTAWGTPVTIDATGNVGRYNSLFVVNGNPAISYYDDTNGDLKYVRATDASGTAWGTSVTIDATGFVGQYTSLAVVNGHPAISYYDLANANLKYVRATDASGTAWGMPVTLASTGDVGRYPSLAIVNGHPAISYNDFTNGDLKYVRATNASGTAWGTPITVRSGDVGQFTSLAIVYGNPAISYYDYDNGNLAYARASDASGTAWSGGSATFASVGTAGQYTSMANTASGVGIAFYDASEKWPMFVHGALLHYRTAGNATFTSPINWESSLDGTTWNTATTTPDGTPNTLDITIRNGHTATVNTDITLDQLTVANGGTLLVYANDLTLNDGTGTDLTIQNGGTLFMLDRCWIFGAGSLTLASGGTLTMGNDYGLDAISLTGTETFATGANYVFVANYGFINGLPSQTTINNPVGLVANNVTISNAAGVDLSNDLTVTGTLTFTNGPLRTGSNKLILGSGASVAGETGINYVMGTIESSRTVNASLVNFGDMGVVINATTSGNNLGAVTVTRKAGANTLNTSYIQNGGGSKSIDRIWTISPATQPTTGVDVTLSWLAADDNSISDFTAAQIWKSSDGGATWLPVGSPANASGRSITATFTGFSSITVGGTGSSFPVEWLSFEATPAGETVLLDWATASEQNSATFRAERSINGFDFEEVGTVDAAGNSTEARAYTLTDLAPHAGRNHYRIREVDIDGRSHLSQTVEVFVGENGQRLWPNPAIGTLHVHTGAAGARIRLYDMAGKQVLEYQCPENEMAATLSLDALPAGVYQAEVVAGGTRTVQAVVRQ